MYRKFARHAVVSVCWRPQPRSIQVHDKIRSSQQKSTTVFMTTEANTRDFTTSSGQPQDDKTATTKTEDDVKVNIRTSSGDMETRSISRSFPKAKPAKLVSELEQLLSASSVSKPNGPIDQVTPTDITHTSQWVLTPGGNALYTTLLVPTAILDDFVSAIEHEADAIQHHPHVAKTWSDQTNSWVIGITSTTHQPAGLSMKDVRLANKINEIITRRFNTHIMGADSKRFGAVAKALHEENMKAAERTIADPTSKCALHVQAVRL